MQSPMRLTETFAQYGSQRLRDSFWRGEWDEWHFPIHITSGGAKWMGREQLVQKAVEVVVPRDRSLLRKALRKSYAVRSGLVHRGRRLPITDSLLFPDKGVSEDRPLPFSVLRAVLVELIDAELRQRSKPVPLPDIKILVSDRREARKP